ncbi:PAQR family membrane homeostasis protein TrhA [Pseudonocardia endophytica]|uniref:Hemolysin III n=1 Tax=Pseudonocardia endophytica TaxID=401976 RepID=A0A4R1HV23_PSEEN|nr:hemolysin III family protein [Pseudonocardia endophytica]TCK26584.1 hemolysin III [Pseudonocardia endophytica]
MSTDVAPPPVKPLLRGRLHQCSFVASAIACAVLTVVAATVAGSDAAVSTAVYGVTILGLFGVSALYHRRTWTVPRHRALMKRLDHSMIFLFIAGTYTPVSVLALPRPTATWVLAVVWVGALLGVVLTTAWPNAPSWVGVPIYIALGWVAVFVLPALLRGGGVAALVLLLAGGLLYTVGGVVYALRRPNPWPATFGYHEVFHAATVLAAACHHIAIWMVVLPG